MLLLSHFTKKCSKCQEIKIFSEFSNKKAGKYGFSSQCKECDKTYRISNKERNYNYKKEYYIKNKQKILEQKCLYNAKNKERKKEYGHNYYKENIDKRIEYNIKNKNRISENRKTYAIENQEKIIYRSAEYYKKNKEKITLKNKNYRTENKDKIKATNKKYSQTEKGIAVNKNKHYKRRAKEKQGDLTTEQLLNLQKNAKTCYWCNVSLKKVKVHIDHYIPLSKGGEHILSNLVVSCGTCNMKKNAKDPHIFANSIGKLL